MALRISLRDGEKVIVNGAVLRASGRTTLEIENTVALLRERDMMRLEDANTPARRLYFACMMAYIDEAGRTAHQDAILTLIKSLVEALHTPEAMTICVEFAQKIASGNYYRALADCRALILYEEKALSRAAQAAA